MTEPMDDDPGGALPPLKAITAHKIQCLTKCLAQPGLPSLRLPFRLHMKQDACLLVTCREAR